MFVAGIDIGSLCTKAVILKEDKKIVSYTIIRSGSLYKEAAETAIEAAATKAGIGLNDLSYIISTGYGRARVPFSKGEITEISCHARGIREILPDIEMVIDIGGQDSKIIYLNQMGQLSNFVMNDKCAAGTGRFLEVMATALGVSLEEMGRISLQAKEEVEISSMCTVFAESEVISLFAGGYEKAEIAAGIHQSIARRVVGLIGQLGVRNRIAMSGGVAKSIGVVRALESKLGVKIFIPDEPQIIGALGAALIALDRASS
ncbi:MAG: 2-hydroxyglutaryl-CoA dehydratase [Candidatus Tectomicrobia bacterium]|uniref:2-hydroxyglutaryl-CoA dehydratase n=1 Tax=Tectimicrobiota bacterium TaxID=2528274 RepID=A0A933LR55_UNCTE|nr:2-hydroxyglutaryl-CoA dehydratase [Candidatus Tectomicrobia bacterium]